jgi:hypothetical protein
MVQNSVVVADADAICDQVQVAVEPSALDAVAVPTAVADAVPNPANEPVIVTVAVVVSVAVMPMSVDDPVDVLLTLAVPVKPHAPYSTCT